MGGGVCLNKEKRGERIGRRMWVEGSEMVSLEG